MRIVSSGVGTFVALRSAFSAISSPRVKRSFSFRFRSAATDLASRKSSSGSSMVVFMLPIYP
ncbi:MAG: hypothetical protein U1G05_15110 [Kiritimatiellia bacterium]